VVWYDETPTNGLTDICYKQSTDAGASWSTNKKLTWTAGDSKSPAIAIDALNVLHVVWFDYTPGNPDIYYRNSTDAGATWSTIQNLTLNSGNSMYPAMAVDSSGNVHVLWEDDTPGNKEIYYRKSVK
jgi:hypothetical protein